MGGRKQIDTVVAPAKSAGEFRDWHHFDNGDSDAGELAQLFGGSAPCSFFRECADVHFVNDLAFQFQSGPILVSPREFRWIDDTGGTVRSIGLKA